METVSTYVVFIKPGRAHTQELESLEEAKAYLQECKKLAKQFANCFMYEGADPFIQKTEIRVKRWGVVFDPRHSNWASEFERHTTTAWGSGPLEEQYAWANYISNKPPEKGVTTRVTYETEGESSVSILEEETTEGSPSVSEDWKPVEAKALGLGKNLPKKRIQDWLVCQSQIELLVGGQKFDMRVTRTFEIPEVKFYNGGQLEFWPLERLARVLVGETQLYIGPKDRIKEGVAC